jgi:hypothetical protein
MSTRRRRSAPGEAEADEVDDGASDVDVDVPEGDELARFHTTDGGKRMTTWNDGRTVGSSA